MCPKCGGLLPFDTDDPAEVCKCGTKCWPDEPANLEEVAA